MRSSQTARWGVLAAAVALFLTGAISLAFVSGKGSPPTAGPASSSTVPGSTATLPSTTLPSTTLPTTTTVSTAPASTPPTVTPQPGGTPSAGGPPSTTAATAPRHLANTGFDSNIALAAMLAMVAGMLMVWVEERTRLLGQTLAAPSIRTGPYRAQHRRRR